MQFLIMARTILTLIPLIIQTVRAIEEAFPDSGKGDLKLDIIKTALESSVGVSDDIDEEGFSRIWPVIVKVVGSVLSIVKVVAK